MAKTAARPGTAGSSSVDEFVGRKIRELRGTMTMSDFAARCGMHQLQAHKIEDGEPACLSLLESIAGKYGKDASIFFPDGKIPRDYPRL